MAIELVDAETDPASEARIVSEVLRWLVFDQAAIEHMRARTPSRRDWLGVLDGQPVGVGASGVPVEMEASGAAVAMLLVLREARHRGVGRLLYRQLSDHARELGRSELLMFSFEDDPDTRRGARTSIWISSSATLRAYLPGATGFGGHSGTLARSTVVIPRTCRLGQRGRRGHPGSLR